MFATARSTARSNNGVSRSDKKFCGVCHKKGLAESVYTSHYTKSVPGPKGIVVCPTILSAHCRYCDKTGHWANEEYCAAMRQDKKSASARDSYAKQNPVVCRRADTEPVKNRYAVLSEAPPAPVARAVEEYPALPSASANVAKASAVVASTGVSWSEMAKKPAVEKEAPLKVGQKKVRYYYDVDRPEMTEAEIEARKILEERRRSNPWAYTEDSDDDEDEYEEEVLEDDSDW